MIKEAKPVIDIKMRGLCRSTYPGHPKGCPKFGKSDTCPPKVGFFEKTFDLTKPVYVIWTTFDLGAHVSKLKLAHPNWSDRQLKCCLYWQPGARKNLKNEILNFKNQYPDLEVTTVPEAMGVNITETMKSIGISLQWPPTTTTYQIALAGTKLQNS
jgi:predicted metal-binding protein